MFTAKRFNSDNVACRVLLEVKAHLVEDYQMKRFVSEWLESRHISIDNPIKKKKLGLCSGASNSSKSVNTRRKDLQNNVKMFAQLPIATQARGSDFVQS